MERLVLLALEHILGINGEKITKTPKLQTKKFLPCAKFFLVNSFST